MANDHYRYLNFVTSVFVTCLIVANIIAVKRIGIAWFMVPAGVIIFPVSYIIADVLTEVYGFERARRAIWIGFGCNAVAVVAIMVAGRLPSHPSWEGQAAYLEILGFAPRLLVASFVAYLAGEFLNAVVLAKMKVATQGKWLWVRTIASTMVGQGVDSLLFISLAFVGVMGIRDIAITVVSQWAIKTIYEAIATPATYWVVRVLKRRERIDAYDTATNFNPFRVRSSDER